MIPTPTRSTRTDTLFPDTTLVRSRRRLRRQRRRAAEPGGAGAVRGCRRAGTGHLCALLPRLLAPRAGGGGHPPAGPQPYPHSVAGLLFAPAHPRGAFSPHHRHPLAAYPRRLPLPPPHSLLPPATSRPPTACIP